MNSFIETLNLWSERFIQFAQPMFIQSSVLIAFLLVLDLALRKKVRAAIRYGLWMLVLIKLILPPSFASPTGLGYWLPTKQAKQIEKPAAAFVPMEVTVSYSQAAPTFIPTTVPLPPPQPQLTWPAFLLLGWATVAFGLLVWLVLRARFVARMSARAQDVPDSLVELLEVCRRQLKIKRQVRLKLSSEANGPAVCGLWRPTILIPAPLANKLSALRMRAVLLHELSHIKRGDLWVNYAQTLLQIFYWYNPLLWLASAVIRCVREQAVDEMVMVEMGQQADVYPTTLLEVAKLTLSRSVLSLGLVGIMESKGALKDRIQTLLSRPIPKVARLGWKGLTCIGLLALIALPMASRPKANAVTLTGITTDPQFGAVLQTLEDRRADAQSNTPADGRHAANSRQTENNSEPAGQERFSIIIADNGKYRLGTNSVDLAQLRSALSEVKHSSSNVAAQIKADAKAPFSDVIRVIDLCKELGISTVTMETSPTSTDGDTKKEVPIRQKDKSSASDDLPTAKQNKIVAATLVQDGRGLYELGKLDEAEAKLNQALRVDPGNVGANYYLNLIRQTRYAEITRKRKQPVLPIPHARTDIIHISEGRQVILSKLDRIRFDEVHFDGLPLSEVIKALNIEARKRDPDKIGVNFIINPQAEASPKTRAFPSTPPAIAPTTGLPADAKINSNEPVDVNAVVIKINPAITDVRLADVLDAILKVADKPIKYSVEDYAVVFSLKGNEPPPLFTRFFKVDPNTFIGSLQKQTELAATASADEKQQAIRKFFSNLGADFQLPKSILFNDQTGALMARATLQDLDIVESALQILNTAPLQITIEAKFIEVPEQVAKSLWRTVFITNNVGTNAWTSILTEAQMKALLKKVESERGVDILTTPRVTTLSGRQARIEVKDAHTVLKGINPQALKAPGITTFTDGNSNTLYFTETMLFGPAIDVIPSVMADGYTISMAVIPSVTEFLGYDEIETSRVPVYIGGKKERVTVPLPKFRTRQFVSSTHVWDGQTLMIGNPLDASNQIVEKPADGKKRLIVLVTPTIIDPGGNRVHTDGATAPARSAVAPQSPK